MFANCILFATFCSMCTLVRRKKTWRYSVRKVLEFGLRMGDIPVYVSCKFEMYIFKIALVISEDVRIAFLYVLSICSFIPKILNENYILTSIKGRNSVANLQRNEALQYQRRSCR